MKVRDPDPYKNVSRTRMDVTGYFKKVPVDICTLSSVMNKYTSKPWVLKSFCFVLSFGSECFFFQSSNVEKALEELTSEGLDVAGKSIESHLILISVADPGCLSRNKHFSIPDPDPQHCL